MNASTTPIRNIAIIAHVDHGKTTLVDHMFRQGGISLGSGTEDRVMDGMDLERERGITIAAKNCSVTWKGTKINILDTPGHADFSGEVERAMSMVDGAILLVDCAEGPLPQTRFVLSKALARNMPIIVLLNKIDRKDARPAEVLNEVYDVFIDLDATEQQIEFPVLYAIGREGMAKESLEGEGSDLEPLFEAIIKYIDPPLDRSTEPFQLLVSDLGYSGYLGRIAIGRVFAGTAKKTDKFIRIGRTGAEEDIKVTDLQSYCGLEAKSIPDIASGEIALIAGVTDIEIGDTICLKGQGKALPRIHIDEPTVSMRFTVNTSPFSGQEGKHVQSRKIRERLLKETMHNVALQVEESEDGDSFIVKGRGEFQMAILIETMRREGYELAVGRPRVITREIDGVTHEPVEKLYVDIEEIYIGVVSEKLALRKGKLLNLINHGTGRVRLEFSIPSRGLIGYRSEFLTDTRGTGIMNALLVGFEPHRGEFSSRSAGSLVADRFGDAIPYALFHLEPRGVLFVPPGEKLYPGMIIGEHNRDNDLLVNASKTKKLSNMRASGKDEAILLTPTKVLSLEEAIEHIKDDELVEVTPKSIRLRKAELPRTKV